MLKKRISKPSPTEIIEKTPAIAYDEEHWSKDSRGKLFVTSIFRGRGSVLVRPHSGKFDIHSHTANTPWPSIDDINRFFVIPSKVMVIASVNEKAKVTGYTFLRKTKKFSPDKFDFNEAPQWLISKTAKLNYSLFKNYLNSLGVQFRLIPNKGYFFDENLGEFRK